MPSLEVALEAEDELGEGPWWSVASQALWRVDILGKKLLRWDPDSGNTEEWAFEEPIGFAIPDEDGNVVAGLGPAVVVVNLANGQQTTLAVAEPGRSDLRFNDGKADPRGRIWAGTMPDDGAPPGEFYRLDPGARLTPLLDGIAVSNGIGWSPDGATMYYTDSGPQTIWAFDFDMDTAEATNQRVFATDEDCSPDGLTVDAAGGVWSAKWGGNRVVRYEPDGTVSDTVVSPASQPTSCMFGGRDLDTLFVTTASVGLDAEEVSSTAAGSVLAVQPGVAGLPEHPAAVSRNRSNKTARRVSGLLDPPPQPPRQ